MIILPVSIILLLVLVLGVIIVLIERKRISRGILVSSNYLKICIAGITIVILSVGAMVAFYILKIPFYIGLPLFGMGIVYLSAGLVYRHEWKKQLDKWLGV